MIGKEKKWVNTCHNCVFLGSVARWGQHYDVYECVNHRPHRKQTPYETWKRTGEVPDGAFFLKPPDPKDLEPKEKSFFPIWADEDRNPFWTYASLDSIRWEDRYSANWDAALVMVLSLYPEYRYVILNNYHERKNKTGER